MNGTIEQKNNQGRQNSNEVSELKSRITQFSQENDQLKRKLNETIELNRKIAEY